MTGDGTIVAPSPEKPDYKPADVDYRLAQSIYKDLFAEGGGRAGGSQGRGGDLPAGDALVRGGLLPGLQLTKNDSDGASATEPFTGTRKIDGGNGNAGVIEYKDGKVTSMNIGGDEYGLNDKGELTRKNFWFFQDQRPVKNVTVGDGSNGTNSGDIDVTFNDGSSRLYRNDGTRLDRNNAGKPTEIDYGDRKTTFEYNDDGTLKKINEKQTKNGNYGNTWEYDKTEAVWRDSGGRYSKTPPQVDADGTYRVTGLSKDGKTSFNTTMYTDGSSINKTGDITTVTGRGGKQEVFSEERGPDGKPVMMHLNDRNMKEPVELDSDGNFKVLGQNKIYKRDGTTVQLDKDDRVTRVEYPGKNGQPGTSRQFKYEQDADGRSHLSSVTDSDGTVWTLKHHGGDNGFQVWDSKGPDGKVTTHTGSILEVDRLGNFIITNPSTGRREVHWTDGRHEYSNGRSRPS